MEMQKALALQKAGVDTEGALERFSGNSMLYERFLMKFPQDETFAKIAPALDADNFEEALRAAHTLKGVSANLGMNRLFHACSDMVSFIRNTEYGKAKAVYPETREAYEEVCRVITGY